MVFNWKKLTVKWADKIKNEEVEDKVDNKDCLWRSSVVKRDSYWTVGVVGGGKS